MDIIVRADYKCLKSFQKNNLPDFVVLTGKNGTGKTQLLDYLYNASSSATEYDGIVPAEKKSDIPNNVHVVDPTTGELIPAASAEIIIDGKSASNIVYRDVQAPTVEVGGTYDHKEVFVQGENIAQKHLFYKTHTALHGDMTLDPDDLTNAFNQMLGVKKGSGSRGADTQYPKLTEKDIEIIKKIETEFPNEDYSKDPYYYVAFQEAPKTTVFKANLKFLNFQYWARQKAGMQVGEKPWEAFNKMGEVLNFRFELDEPKLADGKFDVNLRDKERKIYISPASLSSGEKVIFSLFVAMYTTNTTDYLPQVLLLDEPDAYLHPSLSKTLLDVIQKVLIAQHNIKVIMTTHSPSTVALVPEESIYKMESGIMEKCDKNEAIRSLTAGINTLSIYYENVKQIFVEADNDNLYLTNVLYHAIQQGNINREIHLNFLNVGNSKGGGCDTLEKVVNDLVAAKNKTVYGIVDYDGKKVSNDRIRVLGEGRRYAVDNYYTDPMAMALLIVTCEKDKLKIGFSKHDSIAGFIKKSVVEKQSVIDAIIFQLESVVSAVDSADKTPVDYETVGGEVYHLPQWFMSLRGHNLVNFYKKAFPELNRHNDEKKIIKEVCKVYDSYPEIIPVDLVETLRLIADDVQ